MFVGRRSSSRPRSNAFFPLFLLVDVLQLFAWPLLLSDRFVAALAANSLYLVAAVCYWHITFLGYSALPFLQRTAIFVYPIGAAIVGYFVLLAAGTNCAVVHARWLDQLD